MWHAEEVRGLLSGQPPPCLHDADSHSGSSLGMRLELSGHPLKGGVEVPGTIGGETGGTQPVDHRVRYSSKG